MTILIEGAKSFFLGAQASLVNPMDLASNDRELAWAERAVKANDAYRWVLGRFVEADNPNRNKQFWALDHLRMGQPTIQYAPMNLLHRARDIVGVFVDTEMVYPTGSTAAETAEHPYIEALGAFYKFYFPDELKIVEAAHATGTLFFSMECIANSITCGGESGCGKEFDYAGPRSEDYCDHLNGGLSNKELNEPHFLGGALIFPPEKPGWPGAEVKDLSKLVEEHAGECERAYSMIAAEAPHLSQNQWEYVMGELVYLATAGKGHELSRTFSQEERMALAKKGQALPDGSYPTPTMGDLDNAIHAYGRCPAAKRGELKSYLSRRAKALNAGPDVLARISALGA